MSYQFRTDHKIYYKLYSKYKEAGNLEKAAEHLLEAIRLNNVIGYKTELASLYSDMGQLDMSNQECFDILSLEPKNSECMSILSNNFIEKKNFRAAYYYFSKYDNYAIEELDELISAEADLSEFSRYGFRLVWSKGVRDNSDLKEEAEIYLGMKSYKDAINTLKSIPENSKQYIWARRILVYCYYMTEDYESALNTVNGLINNSACDIAALAVAYNILAEMNENERANEYATKIKDMPCADINDIMKMGYCLMDAKRYEEALTVLKREQSRYPYNDLLLILMSSAYYMINEPKKSKAILLRIINMYKDRTNAKYYLKSINLGESTDGAIAYGIPAMRALEHNMTIEKAIESDKFRKEFLFNKEFKDIVRWRIKADSTDDYAFKLISHIGETDHPLAASFLEEILLCDKMSGEIKVSAIAELMFISGKSKVSLVYDSYFRTISLISPKDTSQAFLEAYSLCSVYLAPILKDYEEEIHRVFLMLNFKLKDKLKSMQSPEALASLILYHCKNLEISNEHKIITGLFGATVTTFRRYLKILECVDNDNTGQC